jgi:hypothetical protein
VNRVFYSDNGILIDFSAYLNDYHNGSHTIPAFVALEDAIYIGNTVPFNHIYFKLDTYNTNSSLMSVAYWDSKTWTNAVEVIDETMTNGKSFSQSGFVTWTPSKDESWVDEDTNYKNSTITGLTSISIYDLYWLKISFSANLSSFGLSWVGQKFSDDDTLGAEFPDLVRSAVMSAWESGKTTWEEQHVIAADIMAKDLMAKGLILEKGQILDRFDLDKPAVQKVAEIIYGGLGADYTDQKLAARKEYDTRLNTALPKVDTNLNGRVDTTERTQTGKLYR